MKYLSFFLILGLVGKTNSQYYFNQDSEVIVSQGLNQSNYDLETWSHSEKQYNSGPKNLPIYIYLNFPNKYYTSYYSIGWQNQPQKFSVYISENCSYKKNNYSIDNSVYSYNFSEIESCGNWNQIPNYMFYSMGDKSEAWVCGNLICHNIDDYIMKNLLIKVEEHNYDSLTINHLIVQGLNTTDMVTLTSPQEIIFNSSVELHLMQNNYYYNPFDIKLGNKDCSIFYKNITLNNDYIYNYNGTLDVNNDHYICYNHYPSFSNIYFPQNTYMKMYSINDFQPRTIQKSSGHLVTVNSNYDGRKYIAIARDGECSDNFFSETQIFNNQSIFYDNSDEVGEYYLCYSIDDNIYAQLDIKIKIVEADINKVSGCNDRENRTYDCPTLGNTQINIYGTDFDTLFQNPKVFIGDYEASNISIVNTTLITCILPEGMGIDNELRVEFNNHVFHSGAVSYKKPEILGVTNLENTRSCSKSTDENNTIIDCPNDEDFHINIYGNDFGYENSKVLVGSQFCEDIHHYNHNNITCKLSGDRGSKRSVFIIQYQGEISDGKNFISFKECDAGYEFINGDCSECLKGYYKEGIGDTTCTKCPENKASLENGMTSCDYCPQGYEVTDSSSLCSECGDRFYKSDITAISCANCLDNQITNTSNSSVCYYCQPGYEVIENKCTKCNPGYFKKNSDDAGCLFCAAGKYSMNYASSDCDACPQHSVSNDNRDGCKCLQGYYNDSDVCIECDNKDFHGDEIYLCSQEDLHLFNIQNNYGYWRANKYSTTFYSCKEEEHCPIETIVNNSVVCKEYHTGILCNLCIDNYEKDSLGTCTKCNSNVDQVKNLTITYFTLGIIFYITFIFIILNSNRGILLKFINFMKERGFIEDIEIKDNSSIQYSNTQRKYSDSSFQSVSTVETNSSIDSYYDNDNKKTIENLNDNRNAEKYLKNNLTNRKKKNSVSSTTDTLENNDKENGKKFMGVADNLQQKFKILISYLQIMSLLSQNLNLKWPDFINNIVTGFDFVNLDIFSISGHDIACSFNTNYYNTLILYIITIPVILLCTTISYFLALFVSKRKKAITDKYIYCLVLIIFLVYPSVGSSMLKIYKCEEIEGVWYLSEDLTQQCFTDIWTFYAIIAGVFGFIYIIGIPLLFYFIMKKNLDLLFYSNKDQPKHASHDSHDPQQINEIVEIKTDEKLEKRAKQFAYRYGFLYMGYENKYWWFELVEMMKKIILLATVIYLDESATRVLIAMLMCFGYLGYISYNKPLKYDDDDYLNVLSAAELFLMLLCGLILEVKLDVQDTYNEYAFQGFMFVLLTGVLVIGNYEILKSLFGGHLKPFSILKAILSSMFTIFTPLYNILFPKKKEDIDSEDEVEEIEMEDLQELNTDQNKFMMNKFMESFV